MKIISDYANRLRTATFSLSLERIRKVMSQLNSNEIKVIMMISVELPIELKILHDTNGDHVDAC